MSYCTQRLNKSIFFPLAAAPNPELHSLVMLSPSLWNILSDLFLSPSSLPDPSHSSAAIKKKKSNQNCTLKIYIHTSEGIEYVRVLGHMNQFYGMSKVHSICETFEVDGPNSITSLNWTLIVEWYVAKCGSKNGHQKDMW